MDQSFEQDSQTSKYNDANLSIMRLNNHYMEAEHYANRGNLQAWKYKLDSIWRELYPDVVRLTKTKPEHKNLVSNNNKLIKKIAEARNAVELYFILHTRHEFLRALQDAAGKAGVYIDENNEDFE